MKAVALLSGGLDSILAVKLVEKQGIDVVCLNFASPFFSSKNAEESARANKLKLKVLKLGDEYTRMVRKPKYGYGGSMNPCISCKIMMLKKAWEYAGKIGAKFVVTGFVLGQRPMSQHMHALKIIAEESGLKGKLLNPLSAKLLPETEAEKKGWVDRSRLMDIQGRGRKKQIKLAKELNVKDYPTPAGGCLLCDESFSRKLKDLFGRKKKVEEDDIEILKYGRHFRIGESKIIVGRNEAENNALEKLKYDDDFVFEVKGAGSPITILQGEKTEEAIRKAAELTARYSDADDGEVNVSYEGKAIAVSKPLSFDEKEFII